MTTPNRKHAIAKTRGRDKIKKDAATPVRSQAPKKILSPVARSDDSKAGICLSLLRRSQGSTIAELKKATGWQSHSVRGFLSGHVKKKLGHKLESSKSGDRDRAYRIPR